MEFTSDVEIKKIAGLAPEFYENILDNRPFFVSDEATIFDISGEEAPELINRISNYYGKMVSMADLRLPLWELICRLNQGRSAEVK